MTSLAGDNTQCGCQMGFARAGISVEYQIASLFDKVQRFKLGQCGPGLLGEFLAD